MDEAGRESLHLECQTAVRHSASEVAMAARRSTGKQRQLGLELAPARTWGGRRKGAGRKPEGTRAGMPHRARPKLGGREPVHVTWRMAKGVPSLRGPRCRGVVREALEEARDGDAFRVVEWAALPSHLHLVVECAGARALANGLRSLASKLLRRLGRTAGVRGPLVVDRFHAHVLGTLREAVNAVRYVRDDRRRHLVEHAAAVEAVAPGCGPAAPPPTFRDPLSSASPTWLSAARTWLLRTARRRLDGA